MRMVLPVEAAYGLPFTRRIRSPWQCRSADSQTVKAGQSTSPSNGSTKEVVSWACPALSICLVGLEAFDPVLVGMIEAKLNTGSVEWTPRSDNRGVGKEDASKR